MGPKSKTLLRVIAEVELMKRSKVRAASNDPQNRVPNSNLTASPTFEDPFCGLNFNNNPHIRAATPLEHTCHSHFSYFVFS